MNRILTPGHNGKLFPSMVVFTFVGIAVTLLVSSTILYFRFETIALGQVYRSDLNSLNQTGRELADMTEIAKALSFQIKSDLTISRLLYYPDANVYDEAAAMLQLRNYRYSLPFIDSVYVYNGHTGMFYISSGAQRNGRQEREHLDDRGILDILDNYERYMPYVPIPRTYTVGDRQERTSSYTYLGYDIFTQGKPLDNAVIVNISESWLNRNIGDPREGDGYTFFMDREGRLLSGEINRSMAHLPHVRRLLASPGEAGYFVDTVDGTKSLVTYTAPNDAGWRYVRVTPYRLITSGITAMRLQTAAISFAILLLGMLLSFAISRKLYNPINSIIAKLSKLETEMRNHRHALRQQFLRDIMLGREMPRSPALEAKLAYYGIDIDSRQALRLVLLRIDRYGAFCRKYNLDEQQLLKYAIRNIAAEICNPHDRMDSVDMGDDCLLLVFSADADRFASAAHNDRLREIHAAVLQYLNVSVSMTASPALSGLEQARHMYEQCYEASFHRLFHSGGCLLDAEAILALKEKAYTYPTAKEKQLVEAVMSGRTDESKRLLADILDETGGYSYTVVQLAISHLSLTMNNMLHAMRANNPAIADIAFDTSAFSIRRFDSLDDVKAPFFRLFDEIGGKLEQKRRLKRDDLIRCIQRWIERDYAEPDLNLNAIAERLGMTPAYISRLYKQATMQSLTDAVNDLRMRKSRELLLATDIPVAEIAGRTGFSTPSYFFRMFKRTFGVTPSDFRRMHRRPAEPGNVPLLRSE